MHSNTEGNSPSLRAQLGVGWNRALPAPFSFDNCILPDGVNDYIEIPTMNTKRWNDMKVFTLEWWVNLSSAPIGGGNSWFCPTFADGGSILINSSSKYFLNGNFSFVNNGPTPYPVTTGKHHMVVTLDYITGVAKSYLDGALTNTNAIAAQPDMDTANPLLSNFRLLCREGNSEFVAEKVDEMRLYSRVIGLDEIIQNYNLGNGNNPAKTEALTFWFDFHAAESDVALWPGGNPVGWSAGRWGLRDKSGKDNHAMQFNMANDATLGGTLTPF